MKNKSSYYFLTGLIVTSFIFSGGCSGSSSSSGTGSPSLSTLSDMPSMDASKYDYSAVEGLLAHKLNPHAMLSGTAVGGFSRAACENYTLKRQLFQDARQIENFLCYIKTLESETASLKVTADAFGYYAIHFAAKVGDKGPPPLVHARLGKFGDQLKMDVCMPNNADVWEQGVEVRFQASSTGYEGYVVNTNTYQNNGETFNGNSKIEVALTGTGTASFTDATFRAYHKDTNGAGQGWTSMNTFTADDATKTNTLMGAQRGESVQWGTNYNRAHGEWGQDLIGTVKFLSLGEHEPPTEAQCLAWGTPINWVSNCVGKCYNETGEVAPNASGHCEYTYGGTESFGIDPATTPPTFSILADAGSPYFAAVDGVELPTLADIDANVQYVEAWDCNAEGAFIDVDATAIPALASCEQARDEEMWKMCEEQQQIAKTAK